MNPKAIWPHRSEGARKQIHSLNKLTPRTLKSKAQETQRGADYTALINCFRFEIEASEYGQRNGGVCRTDLLDRDTGTGNIGQARVLQVARNYRCERSRFRVKLRRGKRKAARRCDD